MMQVACPKCGTVLNLPRPVDKARCGKCKTAFDVKKAMGQDGTVPATDAAASAPKGAASGPSTPFNEKMDALVAKMVPAKWLATAFAGAALGTLLFLVLMIIAFATRPETPDEVRAAAQKQVDDITKKLETEEFAHQDTRKKLADTQKGLAEAKKTAALLERDGNASRKQADAQKTRAERAEATLADTKQTLADTKKAKAESDRAGQVAQKEANGQKARADKFEQALAALRDQHNALRSQKDERAKVEQKGMAAFDEIIASLAETTDPAARAKALADARRERTAEVSGTVAGERLDAEIERARGQAASRQRAALKEAARDAKKAYAAALRDSRLAKEDQKAIEILSGALDEVAGSAYEGKLKQELVRRQDSLKLAEAKAVFDEVTKKVRAAPNAYEENLAALEEALPKTQATKYEKLVARDIEARRKTLGLDVARAAYESVRLATRKSPDAYDENIAAAEAALPKVKGTRYEKPLQSLLETQKTERLFHIGRAAYDKAVAKVKESTDRAENVAALEELKATAAGSPFEPKIDALLRREKKLLERSKK